MTRAKGPPTPAEVALQQAYRALELADGDRRASIEREQALADQVLELRAHIDERLTPQIARLEHANADLLRRCRDAEQARRETTA